MPRRLDEILKKVACTRQVSIKTARDWRDSSNNKWFLALEKIKEDDLADDLPYLKSNEGEIGGNLIKLGRS